MRKSDLIRNLTSGRQVGFNVRLEERSRLTVWDSSLIMVRRHTITILIRQGGDGIILKSTRKLITQCLQPMGFFIYGVNACSGFAIFFNCMALCIVALTSVNAVLIAHMVFRYDDVLQLYRRTFKVFAQIQCHAKKCKNCKSV